MNVSCHTKKLVHQNAAGCMYWVDDTFLYLTYNEIDNLREEESSEFLVAVAEQFECKVPLIVDRIHNYSVDEGTIQFVKEFAASHYAAIALVGHDKNTNWVNRYTRDRFSSVLPSEAFTDLDSALIWIKTNHCDGEGIPPERR